MENLKKVTCIECPLGCEITVEIQDGVAVKAEGNRCPRGAVYAKAEVVCPKRVITTTVRCASGGLLPVKTDNAVEKSKIFEVMKRINAIVVKTPVCIGQIIAYNIFDGVNLIATDSRE